MVATTGAQLLPEIAIKTLCHDLLPKTYILTPNIPEANLILKEAGEDPVDIQDVDGLKRLAAAVHKLGPKYVLIKGGHVPLTTDYKVVKSNEDKAIVANVLLGEDVDEVVESRYRDSRNTHGTGCSLACMCATIQEFSVDLLILQQPQSHATLHKAQISRPLFEPLVATSMQVSG